MPWGGPAPTCGPPWTPPALPRRPWTAQLWLCGVLARRNPTVLLRLVGEFLLRLAERAFCGLLFQLPPRMTGRARLRPAGCQLHEASRPAEDVFGRERPKLRR